MCEQLRNKEMDMHCLKDVRWRGQGGRFVGIRGTRYKLQWSGNNDGIGAAEISMKEKLCEKVVEIQ